MSKQTIQNDKNVYILGAGFSRLAGLPLSSDFMNYMRDQHQFLASKMITDFGRNSRFFSRPHKAIDAILKYRLSASSVNYRINIDLENIEELFSLGTIATSDRKLEEQIRIAIGSVIHAAQARYKKDERTISFTSNKSPETLKSLFDNYRDTGNGAYEYETDVYSLILAMMIGDKATKESDNSIITLNYDTIVENTIWKLGLPLNYGLPKSLLINEAISTRFHSLETDDGIKVLKLHGSINWQMKGRKKLAVHDDYGFLIEDDRGNFIPYIIPPIASKNSSGVLSTVWQRASAEISNATRIVIIGYSFPQTDNHIRYLIANGLSRNSSLRELHVWDINPQQVVENWGQLSQYSKNILQLTTLSKDGTGYMDSLLNPATYRKIGRYCQFQNVEIRI